MALLGKREESPNPISTAASLNNSFSPTPLGRDKSAFSDTGSPLRKLTTSSSKYGNLSLKKIYTICIMCNTMKEDKGQVIIKK